MAESPLKHLDQLLHTVERGRALNVDNEGRLPVRLYGPDGQPLFTEQNPAHVKGEVTLTGQLGGQINHHYIEEIPRGTAEFTVFEHIGPMVLDHLSVVATSRNRIVWIIYTRVDGVWHSWRNLASDGSEASGWVNPEYINERHDDRWYVVAWDENNSRYKFALRHTPLSIAEGIRITMRNTSTVDDYNAGLVLLGRAL